MNSTPGSMDLTRKRSRQLGDEVIRYLLICCALVTVLITFGIVLILLFEAVNFFRDVPVWEFLFGRVWTPLFAGPQQRFGVLPLLAGTLMTSLVAALIALPLGLAAAIYLSEYATQRTRLILKPVLEVLAGVPTIVYGFFALTFITPVILQPLFPSIGTFNGLSAGIAIGIMTMPTIASLSEDALRAVPHSLREAGYGLGGTRFEITMRIVVPAALSGIVASFILAVSRAIGETMIVAIAAGQSPAGQSGASTSMFDLQHSMQTMTGFIAYTFSSDAARGTTAYYSLFGVGLLLFAMTLVMNLVSQWVTRRFREEYQ